MSTRLKSLELHGYKTFASRTNLDFPGTVTAIVGPNGSGKSNIADAIRWVLGEQSYSLLRGKKTEDMIFSGSEQRSRAGMASATVVFDNEDHWLPVDFSEVAISRRAYRDGQNEYLLNGQRVRLKDVSEILAQSGLAERTYTIIGQGLVDAALALKAEERRRLFEEAAGIGLHRTRKEEALRRLEITLRNLERVQDILAELEPRLRSLERQARRAIEYERLKDELRALLREWYGFHWHRAQTELTEARTAARHQEKNLKTAKSAEQDLDQQLQASRTDIHRLREQLNEWHRLSASLHARREEISRNLAVLDERQRFLVEQETDLGAQRIELEEATSLLQSRQEGAQAEVELLEADFIDSHQQLEISKLALSGRLKERESAIAVYEQAHRSVTILETRRTEWSARQLDRNALASRLEKNLAESREKIAAMEIDVQAAIQDNQLKAIKVEAAESERDRLQVLLTAEQVQFSALEEQIRLSQEALTAKRADLAGKKTQLEVLVQAEDTLTGYADGARLLLEAARRQQISGVRGALSSFLEVPDGLETAVMAALGEYLDAILLDSNDRVDRALEILSDSSARGMILPVDTVFRDGTQFYPKTGGDILGPAADLVESVSELRPVVDLLLRHVLIVRDRQTARKVLMQVRGQGMSIIGRDFKVVTLQGEVFYAHGAVQSGQENKSGALIQKKQRKRLEATIASLEDVVESDSARLEGLFGNFNQVRNQIDLLRNQVDDQKGIVEAARSAFSQSLLTIEQISSRITLQTEQAITLEKDHQQAENELSELSSALSSLESEINLAKKVEGQSLQTVNAILIDEFQEQVNLWSVKSALAEQSLVEARTRLQEREISLEESRMRKTGIVDRLQELTKQSKTLDSKKKLLHFEELDIGKEIESLRELIAPAEENLQQRESDQALLQVTESQARQRLNQAEHYHAQAKIKLARLQEALEALRRRIEDDFGLVAFEYSDDVTGPNPLPLAGLVEQLPVVPELSPETDEALKRQRALIRRMGPVNPEAQSEYLEVKQRYEFLKEQMGDLNKAEADVREVITELDGLMEQEFKETFDRVAGEFHAIFARLFGGGTARLVMTDPSDLTTTGIDIEARLPGRREQGLSLLSGGERSLTAVALVFSLLRVAPTPFCVLDEVDAMLDEANVGRFRDLLRELSQTTQFILITHNRNTVQVADVIYGITMGHDSASQMVSLKMDQVEQAVTDTRPFG